MTQAVSRLALIMQMLDISNTDMAKTLDVDHSLLSKWKNNQRRIPVRTDIMPKIVSYLITSDEEQGGQVLRPLLCPAHDSRQPTREELGQLLTGWLQDHAPLDSGKSLVQPPQIWLSKNNYVCPMEVYQGDSGRQIAVMRFFDTALSLPPDIPILMITQEDTNWFNGDAAFLQQFTLKLSTLAASHHHIELIHWIDRKPDDLQAVIKYWLPLHLITQIKSCYYPVYGDITLPMTLFIIPGHLALSGSSIADNPDSRHTMLYSDLGTITQNENIFYSIQAHCQPLMQHFKTKDILPMTDRFQYLWHQSTEKHFCMQTTMPTLMTWSKDQLTQIISDNRLDDGQCRETLENWTIFHANDGGPEKPGSKFARHVFLLDSLEKAIHKPFVDDWMLSAITGRPIKIRQTIFRSHLRQMADELRKNAKLEIALIRSERFHQTAWPNLMIMTGFFVTAWSPNKPDSHIFAQESTLVQGFQRYFNDYWQQIPRICRDRDQIVQQLLDLADKP
ncbi:MAG: hypothetical protein VB070_09440 [Clostridiaceae bacterium]|nr:hypothetical protein [Clostridiaceae bacterium]